MKIIQYILLVCSLCLFDEIGAQNRSIEFREGNWEQMLKMAKKEKKMIFVDCYTSWCGPCKMLAKNIFTQDSVADFYNVNFICFQIDMEKGKVPEIDWIRGGTVAHDYWRLYYEQVDPAEAAYRQLTMTNMLEGGDIRDYKEEFDAYMQANKQTIMAFVRANPRSYISLMNLLEHYNWFDENEAERIYDQLPQELQGTAYGKILKRKLDAGRPYRPGTIAPDFVKKDMNGKDVSLKKLKGKYVLLDFWGSWCGPCRASHPHLKELHKKYSGKVVFVNVADENVKDLEQAKKLWKQAVKEDGMTWTQILNNEGKEEQDLLKLYNITSFPTKILIDPEGKVVARLVGATADPEEFLKAL